MPKSILAIYSFLFLIRIGGNAEYSAPENCQKAQEWPLNGRELIRDYKGRVLLLTFISLEKCNRECEFSFSRLDSLHDHFSSIRVLAISLKNESPSELRAFAWRFPRIRFEHENEISPIWTWFNATHLDQFIFDRCSRHTSRLSPKLSTPNQISPPTYSSTSESLISALTAQPCGLCEYDPAKPLPKWPSLHPPIPTQKLAFAEQRAVGSNRNNRQRDKQHLPHGGREQNRRDSVAVHFYPPQQQPQPLSQPSPRLEESNRLNSQTQMTQQLLQRQREELARVQQQQMGREQLLREHEEQLRQRQIMEEQQRRYWAQQQERQRQIQQQQHFPNSPTAPASFHPHQLQQSQPIQNVQQTSQNIRQIQQPAPVHYANDPYGDRYRFGLSQANNNYRIRSQQRAPLPQQQQRPISMPSVPQQPETRMSNSPQIPPANVGFQPPQIMAPTEGAAPLYPEGSENDYYGYDGEWTTETPLMLQIPKPTKHTAPTTPSMQQQDKNFGFELPCTGFSDESCFQQQTQLRPNEVHRCCRGRILFTDQCIHGKCSNMTTQLCCIQRFLQAKLTCCSDERQAETGIGDHFSRCCFDNFVDSDDLCCPREYAAEQWRSVHEICLPNVEMDLSAIKVPIPLFGTSLITEYDFSKTDKWRFECRYGRHVQQYSFFEKSASEEDENEGVGEID